MASVRVAVTALLALDPAAVDGGEGPAIHAELRAAVDQLSMFSARLLARVEADGRWAAGGERTFGDWMARRHHTSTGAVRRDVALGHALEEVLPGAAAAVAAGSVSLEHARVLAQVAPSSPARVAALAGASESSNEGFLLARAAALPVDRFRTEVQRWAARVDAEAAEQEHERASAKEYLTLSRRHDGVAFQGFLTHEHGAALETALRAVAGVPAATDQRSKEERQAAALVDTARLVLDEGLAGRGQSVRPHLTVHVSWETMQRLAREVGSAREPVPDGGEEGVDGVAARSVVASAVAAPGALAPAVAAPDVAGPDVARPDVTGPAVDGPHMSAPALPVPDVSVPDVSVPDGSTPEVPASAPAELAGGRPIPASVLARLACDSEISRVVFGPAGDVLDLGRAHRTYTGQQRRAVIARDGSCRYPGCGAPASLGEVHHVTSWANGGPTSVTNGVLLCWHHHDWVHRRRLRIARVESGWVFRTSEGTLLDAGRVDLPSQARASVPAGGEQAEPRSIACAVSPEQTEVDASTVLQGAFDLSAAAATTVAEAAAATATEVAATATVAREVAATVAVATEVAATAKAEAEAAAAGTGLNIGRGDPRPSSVGEESLSIGVRSRSGDVELGARAAAWGGPPRRGGGPDRSAQPAEM